MLYQHQSIDARLACIKRPMVVELRRGHTLVGTCCFCVRDIYNQSVRQASSYIRYFSFQDKFRSNALGRRRGRNSQLRQEVEQLFTRSPGVDTVDEKHLYYAYVDPRNTRSVALCTAFQFTEVRRFTTYVFSRLSPRIDSRLTIEPVTDSAMAAVKAMLMNRYRYVNFFSLENLFHTQPYYIAKDADGNIVAGAQVTPGRWKIFSMHNRANTLLMSVLSVVPGLNRLINGSFRFLAVDGLYFREGYEAYTQAFLETLLHRLGYNNALIPADNTSPLFDHLSKLDLGMVSKISKQVSTSVICRARGFSDEEIDQLKRHPAYVSAIDIT